MYVVIEGTLRASIAGKDGPVNIASYGRGDVVGEAGLFYEKRTADVDVTEDSRLLCLTQSNLDRLSRRYPYIANKVFRNLNKVLATRSIHDDAPTDITTTGYSMPGRQLFG